MCYWNIAVSSWIIHDGNYRDFQCGQVAEFALEFHPHKIGIVSPSKKNARHIRDSEYEIIGEVVYVADGVWVIDFGILAFHQDSPPQDSRPKEIKIGSFIAGEIYLGIDPFFYFESLFKMIGMPPLIYTWQVNRVERQIAEAWPFHDDFILHCTKLDIEPKYNRIQ